MTDFILNCFSCDTINPKGAKFCKKCGNPLKEKTLLYYLKTYYKLIVIILVVIVLGTLLFLDSNIHKPNSTQLKHRLKSDLKEKQIITAENCIDYGDGYFCSPLQKELINKYPRTYKSIETECRNLASNYDHTQTVDYNYGDELTAYDIHFNDCIKNNIAIITPVIVKEENAENNIAIINPIIAKKGNDRKSSMYTLSIISSPKSARIRILNIKPKYRSGIRLSKGAYHIEVSEIGYETLKQWINLTKNNSFYFSLKKKIISSRGKIVSNDTPTISNISTQERRMIESVCNGKKSLYGPAAYYKCMESKKSELSDIQPPNWDGISTQEKRMIESVCNGKKSLYGPAAYYKCMERKKSEL